MTNLAGRVAVVTGGARGIGRACCVALGKRGARVVVSDVDDAAGKACATELAEAHGIDSTYVHCDVSVKESVDGLVRQTVDQFGGLDIMVSNAGIVKVADFLDMEEEDFDSVISVNLKGAFLTGQAAGRQMVKQNEATPGRGGSIINMSSVNGVMAIPSIAGYNASKGGLNNLTRCMSLSLVPHGIRVNGVGPGSIMTDVLKSVASDKAKMKSLLSRIPLLRVGEPEEIGEIVAFLASAQSSYITGQIIYADGGRMALNYTVPVPEDGL